MGRSYLYSFLGHLIVITTVFVASRISAHTMSPSMDIYHVSAVSSSSIASLIQQNTVQDRPRQSVPQIQTAAKALPQENVKKSQAVKQSTPSTPTPAVSNKQTDSPGMSGIKTDTEFEYPEYLIALQEKIRENWRPPISRVSLNTRVYFKIGRDGKVLQAYIEEPTPNRSFDAAARNAVIACDPFPSLPEKYQYNELGIHFDFIYKAD